MNKQTNQQIIEKLIAEERIQDGIDIKILLSDEVRQFPDLPLNQSFLMQGGNGVGKTYYVTLFLRDWLINEFPNGFENYQYRSLPNFVKMSSLERFVKDRNGFDQDGRYGAKLALEEIKASKFLILDDFWISEGTLNFKHQMLSELFAILDYRVTNQLQTVVTTNLDLSQIDLIDKNWARITSRIQSFPELELPNKIDRRFQSKIFEGTKPEKLNFVA
jgi:DNA replication protein DnaC